MNATQKLGVLKTDLLDTGLLALRRPTGRPNDLPPSDIVFDLGDLDIKGIELLLDLLQPRLLLLFVALCRRGAFALLAGLRLLCETRGVQRGLELLELRTFRHRSQASVVAAAHWSLERLPIFSAPVRAPGV